MVADKKAIDQEQLRSFLAKVKGYSALKTGSPDESLLSGLPNQRRAHRLAELRP